MLMNEIVDLLWQAISLFIVQGKKIPSFHEYLQCLLKDRPEMVALFQPSSTLACRYTQTISPGLFGLFEDPTM